MPLDQSSFPVVASSAYRTAGEERCARWAAVSLLSLLRNSPLEVDKDHAVDNRGYERSNHLTRGPGRLRQRRAVLFDNLPGHDRVFCHRAVAG